MINRYSMPKMKKIWSEKNKFDIWLRIELLNLEALKETGKISDSTFRNIKKLASYSIRNILYFEKENNHEMISFLKDVSNSIGKEGKKWLHYGLTSTDVIDTSFGYLLKEANNILDNDLIVLLETLKSKAIKYKKTIMIGRTHGIQAEPITLGLKFLLWFDEMERNYKRFKLAREDIEVGKISGAVGTFANVSPSIEEYICKKLNIKNALISTQIISRDNHSFYMATIASIATTIEKISTEIRHLQRTEIKEVEEFFSKDQKGSSAMPHKRNPIASENMCGCARVIRGYMLTAYENVSLWHERDISHSSSERIIIPDATILLNYMLIRFNKVLNKLLIYPKNMIKNMDKTYGLIYSQQIMMLLIEKGLEREKAYNIIQSIVNKSLNENISYRVLIDKSEIINNNLSKKEIKKCFDPIMHLKNLDLIYKRKGLK